MTPFQLGLRRFAKGFVAGGIAQVVLIVGPGLHFSTLKDITSITVTLVFAFMVGGLLGVEKMLSFVPPANE